MKTVAAHCRIRPGGPLSGSLFLQGSKNALLPILAACILRPGRYVFYNVPQITDKDAFCEILSALGGYITQSGHTLTLDTSNMQAANIPPQLMQSTRGSFLTLGCMLARFHRFASSLPGGCRLGKRPVDFHIKALSQMGASFTQADARKLSASCSGLSGTVLYLPFPSVGATENILIAACGASGVTVLSNAAIEPEVIELVHFLRKTGFSIHQTAPRTFTVYGDPRLTTLPCEVECSISGDRIAAVTYLSAAAATGGEILLQGITLPEIREAVTLFERAGCTVIGEPNGIRLTAPKRLRSIGEVITAPYPGFATDMQPPMMGMLCRASGCSAFTETVFENRFSHAGELIQMGADITLQGKTAVIRGVDTLSGRELLAFDLRGGAALTVAALTAETESTLSGCAYIARGYEDFFQNLNALGAKIEVF